MSGKWVVLTKVRDPEFTIHSYHSTKDAALRQARQGMQVGVESTSIKGYLITVWPPHKIELIEIREMRG